MKKDLTRWNRAGLSRFEYIDGRAPENGNYVLKIFGGKRG